MKPLKKFKLARQYEDVLVEDTNGVEKTLRIYEMNGTLRESYMDDMRKRMEFDKDGKPTGKLTSTIGMQTKLLELCLVELTPSAEGIHPTETQVPTAAIDLWPGTVVQELFTVAQSINGLGVAQEKTEEALKNG